MPEAKQDRMQWLDAMRGFTMILVVSYHVAQMGFGEWEKISSSLPFLVLFRMPLFFFVSGFLAFKSKWVWTLKSFCQLTWKKMKIQVLPALVFLCVFIIFRGKHEFWESFLICMKSPYKGGYWFTWVLLLMFLIYYVAAALQQKLRMRHNALLIALYLASVVGCLSVYMPATFGKWWKTDFMMYSSFIQVLKYLQFFLLGNLVHRYWDKAQRLMDSPAFFPVVALVALLGCADFFRWHALTGQWINLSKTSATYALLFIVIMFFRHYRDSFTKETKAGTVLQYIGTRTLDIYLLHFLFIPKLPMVGKWLDTYSPNFAVEIFASVSVAAVVIAFCLLTSNILRVSPLFKQYLFGRK